MRPLSAREVARHREIVGEAAQAGRWTATRKESLLALIEAGQLSESQAVNLYGFSFEEIGEMRRRKAAFGLAGLKVNQLQACGHV
jgi:hypothetical protein